MGKHDRKSFRGKLRRGTYGKRRPRQSAKRRAARSAPKSS
jgi:ribosomal small subunit protein bTHX